MNASLHDAYAADYDGQVKAYGSHVHEALFGLCYEFLQPGQRVLDQGIGTGLAAELFARAGMRVQGMDFSGAMLAICKAKDFADELFQHDIQRIPWPVPPGTCEHLICCGVFHFIPDLDSIFAEANRVLNAEGIFAFTTKDPADVRGSQQKYEVMNAGGMEIYAHSHGYITGLMQQAHLEPLKMMRCFVAGDIHAIWVAKKIGISLTHKLDSP